MTVHDRIPDHVTVDEETGDAYCAGCNRDSTIPEKAGTVLRPTMIDAFIARHYQCKRSR